MGGKPLPKHLCCGHAKRPNDWGGVCLTCGRAGCAHCLIIEDKSCRHPKCPTQKVTI